MKKRLVVTCLLFFVILANPLCLAEAWDLDPGTPIMIPDSKNVHFPDIGHSTLSFTIRTTGTHISYDPLIFYKITEISNDPYLRYLYIWIDNEKIFERTFSNDVSGIINANILRTLGTHTIKIEIYYGAYGFGCYQLDHLKIGYLSWDQNIQKIAAFFWEEFDPNYPKTSGIVDDATLNRYANTLSHLGYTILKYKNPTNWKGNIAEIDYLEDENSILLFYFAGHGTYYSSTDISSVSMGVMYAIDSDELKVEISKLESKRICVIVDSCHSGDFRDKLNMDGVTAITSTDEEHYGWMEVDGETAEPLFSRYYFSLIGFYNPFEGRFYNDRDIFTMVNDLCRNYQSPPQYPLASFRAWYSFFGP